MDCVPLNEGAQFRAQGFFRHQIHAATKKVFQVELQTEVAGGTGGAIELDQHVDITSWAGIVARGGAEQRQPPDPEPLDKFGFAFAQQIESGGAFHHEWPRRTGAAVPGAGRLAVDVIG